MIFPKNETAAQQQEITEFYRKKYPASVGKTEAPDAEIKLSPQQLQEANQAFSDGLFKATRQENAAVMEKLGQAFQNRHKGA
jgi:hypothetical protein